MKIYFCSVRGAFLALSLWFAAQNPVSGVTLTVTPAVTSNTYSGVITLQIAGLTNGEQVAVQKWLDLNSNGAIDPSEPMIDAFKITDNDVSSALIGGITNINVPFDKDSTTGAITATLNFVPAMILENIVGQQIIRVLSPTGRFAPVTATFTVTNGAFAQSMSGTVYSNGVPLPYGVVVVQDQKLNNPVAATVADGSGHYFLPLPPSQYTPIAGWQNCFYDFSTAPSVALTNGMSATNNLYLTNGTMTISGTIYDAASSNGIGGLLLFMQSGSLAAIGFTDTNGNYSAAVAPSFWKIQPTKERLARRAYLVPSTPFQVDATSNNVANANIGLPRGSALFYGRIVNNSNAPLPNVEVDGGTSGGVNNSYDAKGYSDPNGYYAVVALGDSTNYWNAEINSGKNSAIANYIFNTFDELTLSPGQTVLQNFVGLPATATISGHVKDSSGTNVTGVTLYANAFINGFNYTTLDSTTDNSGNYSLAVAAGQWQVQFLTGGFSDNLDAHGYVDLTGPHSVDIPPTNVVLNLTVYPLGTAFLSWPQRSGPGQFGFSINGLTNVTYTVQVSTNLTSTNWANLYSLILTNSSVFVTDPHATNNSRFYRVRKNP